MKTTPFCGVHTALVTPMQGGAVDYASLGKLIDYQIQQGVQGLVPTWAITGESPTLDYDEHIEVIRFYRRARGWTRAHGHSWRRFRNNSTTEQVELVPCRAVTTPERPVAFAGRPVL